MKKSTWTILGIAALLLIVLIGTFTLSTRQSSLTGKAISSPEATKQTIKIGVILPLTGGAGFLGEGVRNSMVLAKEQLDNTKYNYELIFEDDKLEPKESSNAANKLINIDNVDAMVSLSSGTGNVVSPLTQSNKIVHIGIASDSNIAKGEYNFIHWTPPEEENRVFVEELQRRGIKKIAVLTVNQQGAIAIAEDLREKIVNTNIEIVYEERFNFGETDFKTALIKIRESNPEIVVLHAFSPEVELIAKQFQELNINLPLTSIESFEFSEQPELFEGFWYVNAADPTNEYREAYKEKYGKDPVMTSPNAYDAFNLIVQAYETAGKKQSVKPSNEEVIQELSEIKNFQGAVGELNVLDNGIIHSKAVVREVRNGKFVTVRS